VSRAFSFTTVAHTFYRGQRSFKSKVRRRRVFVHANMPRIGNSPESRHIKWKTEKRLKTTMKLLNLCVRVSHLNRHPRQPRLPTFYFFFFFICLRKIINDRMRTIIIQTIVPYCLYLLCILTLWYSIYRGPHRYTMVNERTSKLEIEY